MIGRERKECDHQNQPEDATFHAEHSFTVDHDSRGGYRCRGCIRFLCSREVDTSWTLESLRDAFRAQGTLARATSMAIA
jgi:hypothetical protein